MLQQLKDFYSKSHLDVMSGTIGFYEYHKVMYYLMKSFQVLDDEPIVWWTGYLRKALFVGGTMGISMAVLATYRGIVSRDISFLAEGVTYCMIFFMKFIILSGTKIHTEEYHRFLRNMRNDFNFICSRGNRYRERFFQNQLLIWKASLWTLAFIIGIGIGSVILSVSSLIFYLATHDPNDSEKKRPFLFPLWSPFFNIKDSPYYEIAFIAFNFVPCAYAHGYLLFILVVIVWVSEVMSKADLVIWSISDLMEGIEPSRCSIEEQVNSAVIKHRVKSIVSHHTAMYISIDDFLSVYKKQILYLQELYPFVACLTAYAASEKLDTGEVNVILMLLSISSIIITSIPAYLCTNLALKVNSVSDACWNIPFWRSGPALRPYLLLIMARSTQPLRLMSPGIKQISLETYTSKTTYAYSLFNMLKQLK